MGRQYLELCAFHLWGVNLPLSMRSPIHAYTYNPMHIRFNQTQIKVKPEFIWMKSDKKVLHLLLHDLPFPYHIQYLKTLIFHMVSGPPKVSSKTRFT